MDWSFYHGAGIASVALWLSPLFKRIYFAADMTYYDSNQTKIWGNHPLITPLFSTESTQFIYDGGGSNKDTKNNFMIMDAFLR